MFSKGIEILILGFNYFKLSFPKTMFADFFLSWILIAIAHTLIALAHTLIIALRRCTN